MKLPDVVCLVKDSSAVVMLLGSARTEVITATRAMYFIWLQISCVSCVFCPCNLVHLSFMSELSYRLTHDRLTPSCKGVPRIPGMVGMLIELKREVRGKMLYLAAVSAIKGTASR
jgi:hypothetical protein